MRAKPISFAEVIKSKSRVGEQDPTSQSSLFQIMERYENNPNEDYTLFLGQISLQQRSKTSSFRALSSRNQCEGSQMFDSWIQRQSFVGSKENSQRNMLNSNNCQSTRSKDTKKSFIVPQTKEGKEAIKSVADLVKKIENNDKENSNVPFFRAGPKVQSQRQKPQFQKATRVPPSRNIQFHDNQQVDQDIKINLIKPKQQRPTARPYIEMSTIVKQRPMEREKEKVDLDDLLLKTENIHIEIAELAQKYKQEQSKQHEEMEDSLLIQDSSKKVSAPEVNIPPMQEPKKFDVKSDDAQWMRWETAKSKINNYFQKITTIQQPKPTVKIQNSQQNRQISSQNNNQSVGYSFAVNEIQPISKMDFDLSSLQNITIPKIQQIQSQRLPFEKIHQKSEQFQECHYSPTFVQKQENTYHHYNHNYEYVSPPKIQEKGSNEMYELQQKIVGSSLVFSSNVKGASPSPSSSKQQNSQKRSGQNSENQRVSLSFTEQKPEYVQNTNIQPSSSSKKSEEYQIQTIRVNQEPIEKQSFDHISSPKQEEQEINKQTLNIDIQPRDYNEYRIQNRSFSIDNWDDKKETPQITIKIDSSFNIEAQTNDYQPKSLRKSIKQESFKQSLNMEQDFKPIQPTQPVYIQSYSKNNQQQFNHTLNPALTDNHFMKKSIKTVIQLQDIINDEKKSYNEEIKFDLNDDISKKGSINSIKSGSKGSGIKNSPSNGIYGLKKVYCSPKTDTVAPQVQPITSAFTTINEPKPKIEILHKVNFEIKPAAAITKAWDMKIDTIAYNKLQPMKQSKQIMSSNVQEEGEEFQFDL